MNYTMKLAVAAMTIFVGMLLTTIGQAQTKQPVTNQTVTTDDGRKVVLKSNGTWQYADKKASNAKGRGTLSFETGLLFNSGDTKPVSRTTFYLLDNSLDQILIGASLKINGKIIENTHDAYLNFVVASTSKLNNSEFLDKAWSSIKPHVLQTVVTGFDGKASFKPMPTGKYYLMGYYEVSTYKILCWNYEVNISSGNNLVTLDQNNASF